MPRALLIVNPMASGVRGSAGPVRAALAAGWNVDERATEARGHAAELAAAVDEDVEAVFVLGGDGTTNEVVNGLVRDVPVGALPGGGTNVLPRALGLPRDPLACARLLARAPGRRRISLGRANGRRFTFACGIGLDAELLRAGDRRRGEAGARPGDLSFVYELVRLLARERFHLSARLEVAGHGRCALLAVANGDPYTYLGSRPIRVAPDADFRGGLDLVGPRAASPFDLARIAWTVLERPGQIRALRGLLVLNDVDQAHVRCDRPTPMQLDGEDVGDVDEVRLEVERDALTVFVPQSAAGGPGP